ncbi:uncharacterized protein LOC110390712 isoform X6 [Numida meleagris]|uniref:uncharacterized protein LOC110390712 isoform X6 n=1 Tax=Numida meleagris TaxID=8996 RepID=UPI000B3DDEFF|nr:uncharacterized protein LOC110390712 isoform X6 [Numida meleagris]
MGTCFWVCAAAALRVGVAATCPALQLCSSCGRSPLGGGGHPLCSPSTKVSLWNSAKPSPLAEVLCAAPGPARTVLPALGFWCSHGEVPSHHSAPFLTPPPRPRTPPPLQRDPRAELTRCHQGEGGGQCHGHWSGTAECRTAPLCREWAPGTFNHRSRFPDSHTAETAINLCVIRFPQRTGLHRAVAPPEQRAPRGDAGARHRAADGIKQLVEETRELPGRYLLCCYLEDSGYEMRGKTTSGSAASRELPAHPLVSNVGRSARPPPLGKQPRPNPLRHTVTFGPALEHRPVGTGHSGSSGWSGMAANTKRSGGNVLETLRTWPCRSALSRPWVPLSPSPP